MLSNAQNEVDYRLAKWIVRNMEKEQILTPDEIKTIWRELLTRFEPPTRSIETVTGTIRGGEADG
ncbi:MAG: hypothetical protein IJ719_15080 [Clostridia bacterium]|nr:hypothetical protein [Clostridia bacterium]